MARTMHPGRKSRLAASASKRGRLLRKAAATARSAIASTFAIAPRKKGIKRKPKDAKKRKAHKPPAPHFRLLDLPQELIDIVYTNLLRDGQINILRTSRDVYAQASRLIQRQGVYRISIIRGCTARNGVHYRNLEDYYPVHEIEANSIHPMTGAKLDLIRNVEVHVSPFQLPRCQGPRILGPTCYYCGRWWAMVGYKTPSELLRSALGPFLNPNAHRDTCHVIFKTDVSKVDACTAPLYSALRMLRHFVYVTITYSPKHQADLQGRFPPTSEAGRRLVYEVIKKKLEPTFGPATPVDGKSELGQGLQFWPLKYQKSLEDQPAESRLGKTLELTWDSD